MYSIKRFSSIYSPRKYENSERSEYENQIDSALRGKENQALDEEAERIRWRSSLKKYKSKRGNSAALLGGPGGLAGKWVGERVAEAADDSGKTDDEIKSAGNTAGTIAGLAAGIGTGYAIKKGVGDSANAVINSANKELTHLERYRHDVPKFTKMSAAEKRNITEGIKRNKAIIKANQKRAVVGKYAMPVLGAVGAIAATKAISDSLDDRLSKRKAIDSKNRRDAEIKDKIDEFKDSAKKKLKKAGNYLKSAVTEDYKKESNFIDKSFSSSSSNDDLGSSTVSSLEQSVKDSRKRNNWWNNRDNNTNSKTINSNLNKLDKLKEDVEGYKRKHDGHDREYNALLGTINRSQHQLNYQKKRELREQNRVAELTDVARAREIEDQAGIGNSFKRNLEDAKLNAKYKLQDMSDNYFKNTGRSMVGDTVLSAAALGGGYLAYKAIKKARYEKKHLKDQAENKFIRG